MSNVAAGWWVLKKNVLLQIRWTVKYLIRSLGQIITSSIVCEIPEENNFINRSIENQITYIQPFQNIVVPVDICFISRLYTNYFLWCSRSPCVGCILHSKNPKTLYKCVSGTLQDVFVNNIEKWNHHGYVAKNCPIKSVWTIE